jgi:asparagine synthase (glutamine-hydrolysing)
MADAIRHRGPDGDGFYDDPAHRVALGMRRLSIIDVEGSDQPLYNEDRSLALVFNGEIYNYKELRAALIKQGHGFATEGDGETLLHLYEQHGVGMFDLLWGMYAIALWDVPRARLLLAVDHIGMKPLYLRESGGMLHFASEVKALLTDPTLTPSINLETLDTFMSFGYMIGEETLFAGVRRLPPGHYLIAEGGTTRIERHWAFGGRRGSHGLHDDGAWIAQARDQIDRSVDLHLRADVPLGLFLSGGVDSAAMLALMTQKAGGRVRTFTVGYDADTPDNELIAARQIAAHFGAQHHERVITADDWWGGFERYIFHHDEPNANPSAVSLLLLAEDTARQVKVVLTGLGGDELFCGYPHHRVVPWLLEARWGQSLRPLDALFRLIEPHYPAMKRWRGVGALPTYLPRWRLPLLQQPEALRRAMAFDGLVFSDALRDRLYTDTVAGCTTHKDRAFADILAQSRADDPLKAAQALVIHTWLTGNALLSTDKVTMAHSLEARVPFFMPPLLDFAADLPPELLMRSNKHVLREAMRPLLPSWALERPKQPFSTPILAWFGASLRPRLEAALLDDGALSGLFQRRALERLLRAHFDGRAPQVEVVFRLATLALWLRRFNMIV